MRLHYLGPRTPADLSGALSRFERRFRYPLGPDRSFRIDHGRDYSRFFRAMGQGLSLVAEQEGRVLGVIGAALRTVRLPGGEECRLAYFGDAKTVPGILGARVWLRLGRAVGDWALEQGARGAYAVVMEGTGALPDRYTGRQGIEPFVRIGSLRVLRIPAAGRGTGPDPGWQASSGQGRSRWHELVRDSAAALSGDPSLRSLMRPQWLCSPDGRSVGLLEDTRRAKRLHETLPEGGEQEMKVRHLSHCLWQGTPDGAALVRQALGFLQDDEALFLALSGSETTELLSHLGPGGIVQAPAAIWGTASLVGLPWRIASSEI